MRRTLIGLAVGALAALALAGPASAAPGQVTHFRFHGSFAQAEWFISTDTSFTDTYVNVSRTKQGSELFVDQYTAHFDASGNFTGATDTSADVTSGFTFSIARNLSVASVTGSGLPATTCTYDADYNVIGCTDTTIDVSVTWTGQGPIARETFNQHFKVDGFSETDHFNGTFRDATASGTIGGVPLNAGDLEYADLGTANSGSTVLCIGNSC
jgi:YD repeat-containing protein